MDKIYTLLGNLSLPSLRIKALWSEYEDRKTPESKLTKDLDLIELCLQGYEYEQSQQITDLQEFFVDTVPRIQHPVVKKWATELMEKRRLAWEERKWTNYEQVYCSPDPSAPNGASTSSTDGVSFSMLPFFHLLEQLKTNKRMGWIDHNVQLPESIADHMYRMAVISLVLPTDGGLDLSKVAMLSLVHDMAEAEVGDITPEHVSGVTREKKLALEAICALLGEPSLQSLRIRELWNEYEDRETPESKVTKDLDLFELCLQAHEYEQSQQTKGLQEWFLDTVPRIQHPTIKKWTTELMERRRAAWAERPGPEWATYVQIHCSADTPAVNGGSLTQIKTKATIPVRVWGEHSKEEESEIQPVVA
ncbi:hypothetical protein T439DRAFT_1981 [Meredithblackwellia eburnea MCA 4105]